MKGPSYSFLYFYLFVLGSSFFLDLFFIFFFIGCCDFFLAAFKSRSFSVSMAVSDGNIKLSFIHDFVT